MARYDVECKNCGFKGGFLEGCIRLHGVNYALGCRKCKKIITKKLGEPGFSISGKDRKLEVDYKCECGETNFILYYNEIKEEGIKARESNGKYKMRLTCPSCGKKEMIITPQKAIFD